jgi:hypothetical protein
MTLTLGTLTFGTIVMWIIIGLLALLCARFIIAVGLYLFGFVIALLAALVAIPFMRRR